MAYSSSPDAFLTGDEAILDRAKRRFHACEEWEGPARANAEYDYKFAHADSVNNYQWDNWVIGDRALNERPCLTINKTMQHCLQIINDGKQNKPGVNIRPVGDTASFEAAQIFQEVVRHIEYISNAETVYDNASEFQVISGIGYWQIVTDYLDDTGFDQEIFIRRIKDPRSVYLDPDINEVDGSDASFGFIFSDMHRDLYNAKYPADTDIWGSGTFSNTSDGWFTKDHVRVAKYYEKTLKEDKYISFKLPETGEEITSFYSELPKEAKDYFNDLKKREGNLPTEYQSYHERKSTRGDINVYKIAGDKIIERSKWLGKYIPIVRIVGTETVIDGIMDRKGHTRALLDPQRIYNINSSSNVEYGALQAKTPITAPVAAIEGYEEFYRTANTVNHAILPYNNYDEDGNKLDRPIRMEPPQPGAAYIQQMQIAQNEMMMVTGQYQAQLGENENAKSGVAINARQRQGDRATYHFIDGEAIGIRFTGKILIDLIPKVYDTKRVMQIESRDGTVINLTIDPQAAQAFQKLLPDNDQPSQSNEQIINVIFNPNVGKYTVQSDTGPSFATRRQEAFNALTQIAASNKDFMNIAGDILWKVADFPEAQLLAQRWRRVIPPNIVGDAPNPQQTQMMEQASQKIEQQLAEITKMQQALDSKDREITVKERDVALKEKEAAALHARLDYEAENKRITALGNSGPAITPAQIQPVLKQLLESMLIAGALDNQPYAEDLEAIRNPPPVASPMASPEAPPQVAPPTDPTLAAPAADRSALPMAPDGASDEQPPVEGARKAPDGAWYVQGADGKYMMVN
jgi:hypothetical protein